MDKQKQIEEMVDIYIQYAILEFDKHGFSATTRQMYIEKVRGTMFEICGMFFEEGYRKIPEDAVVLTEEELFARDEKLHKAEREYIKALEKCVNDRGAKVRKEIIGEEK